METLAVQKSNDLRHVIDLNDKRANIKICIRLNDECKNGHQDFAITATIWEPGKVRNDRNMIGGGCCHDDILKLFPNLKTFVNLHLCDYAGIPMYAVENGFYHLREGFNNTKPNSPTFKKEFCDYYRITPEQFEHLNTCENKKRYALKLQRLGILEQWKVEADAAIKQMEAWTGNEFLNDSKKSQYHGLTAEEIAEEDEREKSGYYSTQAIKERIEAAQAELAAKGYQKIEEERDKEILKAQTEYNAKKTVLDAGLSLENFIFYNHTNTGTFNWRGYGKKITKEEYEQFLKFIEFKDSVKGIKWEFEKKK